MYSKSFDVLFDCHNDHITKVQKPSSRDVSADRFSSISDISASKMKTRTCTFWMRDMCQKGDDCMYLHGLDSNLAAAIPEPCPFFGRGFCKMPPSEVMANKYVIKRNIKGICKAKKGGV